MRILLTGISGFIGANVAGHILKNTDWSIVGIESWHVGNKSNGHRLKSVINTLTAEQKARLELIEWNLTHPFTPSIVEEIKSKAIDFVINMASDSHVTRSISHPGRCWQNNCALIYNVLELIRNIEPKKFIQISTDEVYGDAGWDGEGHPEWDTVLPSNPYSASKAAQEALSIAYWRTYDVPLIITNTMNVIGEYQDPEKFLPKVIDKITNGEAIQIHSSGHDRIATRVWLDVLEMAEALIFICKWIQPNLCRTERDRPMRFHIVGDTELNVLEFAKLVAKKLEKPFLHELVRGDAVRPGYDRRYALKDTKLKPGGFKFQYSFDQTLTRIIDWVKQNPNWVYTEKAD